MTIEMIDELLADAKERMQKSVDATRNELATVRTGPRRTSSTGSTSTTTERRHPCSSWRRWRRPMHRC